MTERHLPWPRKGDKLFLDGHDWWHNACVWLHGNAWLIQEGYRQAARILVEKATNDRTCLDAVVYPMTFLYRHGIELTLKNIARNGCSLLSRPCPQLRSHALTPLWGECRAIIETVWQDGDEEDLDAVEQCIEELDRMDRTSQTFRYAETSKGERPLEGVQRINLRNLSEVFERISTFLDCCDSGISEYLQSSLANERENTDY